MGAAGRGLSSPWEVLLLSAAGGTDLAALVGGVPSVVLLGWGLGAGCAAMGSLAGTEVDGAEGFEVAEIVSAIAAAVGGDPGLWTEPVPVLVEVGLGEVLGEPVAEFSDVGLGLGLLDPPVWSPESLLAAGSARGGLDAVGGLADRCGADGLGVLVTTVDDGGCESGADLVTPSSTGEFAGTGFLVGRLLPRESFVAVAVDGSVALLGASEDSASAVFAAGLLVVPVLCRRRPPRRPRRRLRLAGVLASVSDGVAVDAALPAWLVGDSGWPAVIGVGAGLGRFPVGLAALLAVERRGLARLLAAKVELPTCCPAGLDWLFDDLFSPRPLRREERSVDEALRRFPLAFLRVVDVVVCEVAFLAVAERVPVVVRVD